MVAYSFKTQFAGPIVSLDKRQTVRGKRARHARPGEPIQLYTGMRTKWCRKLLDRDPICLDVRDIAISMDWGAAHLIRSIHIVGQSLDEDEMEEFAVADGFRPDFHEHSSLHAMGHFWLRNHGAGRFEGVVIRWEPVVG